MNRAMHDLLASTLENWYANLSAWQVPSVNSRLVCELCSDSPFTAVAELNEWPHDVAHLLVRDLTSVVRHVRVSLEELDELNSFAALESRTLTSDERAARSVVLGRHAETLVLAGLAEHACLMRDVLQECIAPRLDAFLAVEVERAMLQLADNG